MNERLSQLEKIPAIRWILMHPRLVAWVVLAVGMSLLLIIEARDVGLLPTQWLALIVACVLVAGACVWIISWEDNDEVVEETANVSATTTPPTTSTETTEKTL
jgi:hypothetical protein